MVLIIIGFGPYSKFKSNLSGEIVEKFLINDFKFPVLKKVIPVSWNKSIKVYSNFLLELKSKPTLVILLGIHSINKIYLEKYAWNFKIGTDIDKKFKFGPINIHFRPWIKTIINVNKLYSKLKDNINTSISNFPGFFLCNYLYYWALYISKKEYPLIFIHIPQNGDLIDLISEIKMIINTIWRIQYNEDLHI
ncbi:MAG: hypothetical protein ACFE9I_15990 [Candidatus Hermodarchaeota archaeon]